MYKMSTLSCLVARFARPALHTFRPVICFSTSTLLKKPPSESQEAKSILPDSINTVASDFTKEDLKALKVKFQPATSEENVIPNEEVTEFPEQYLCPEITREILDQENFDVGSFDNISDNSVRTLIGKLHYSIRMSGSVKSRNNTLIDDLLRIALMNDWPLRIINTPPSKLHISGKQHVTATPEFVVNKERIALVVDKHLRNVYPMRDFGETQVAAEILASGDDNKREAKNELADQVIFAIRVISTYVTFYKAEIPANYWEELDVGLPQNNSVVINRWPAENGKKAGLDLASPEGRKGVLTALFKIRQHLLNNDF